MDNSEIKINNHSDVYPGGQETKRLASIAAQHKFGSYLDVGTGNGYIAIYLRKNNLNVEALDISPQAIECSRKNAKLNNCQINIFQSDLFAEVKNKYDCITFVFPVKPDGINHAGFVNSFIRKKPILLELARFFGYRLTRKNRIKFIERFISEAKKYLNSEGCALVSILSRDVRNINKEGIFFKVIEKPTNLTAICQIKYQNN